MTPRLTELGRLPTALAEFLFFLITTYGWYLLSAALMIVAALLAARAAASWLRHRRWARDARLIEILPPPESDMAGAVHLWRQMLGTLRPVWKRALLGQPHVVWEYAMTTTGLGIRMWIPGPIPPGLVERAITSSWPGAAATTHPVRPPEADQHVRGGRVRLARPDHYPIETGYDEDPVRALIGAAGDLVGDEEILVQVAVRPITGARLRRAGRAAHRLRHTAPETADPFAPGHRPRRHGPSPEASSEIRAIVHKATQPRLETHIRYLISSTGDGEQARQARRGRSHALAAAFAVFSGYNHYQRRRMLLAPQWLATVRFMGHGDLLTAAELAAVAHLPLDETVPGLQRAPARPVPPPPQVAADSPQARLLGTAEQSKRRTIAQHAADARQHTHIIGGTGTGKTTLLMNMALDDIAKGRGLVMIEPKGESDLLLPRIPEKAMDRVVLIDPDDDAPPPALNVLAGSDPVRTADTITGVFQRIFADSWGPRTDDILRSAVLTLAGTPQASLANIPKLLDNSSFRRRATAHLEPTSVLAGFWSWYEGLSEPARAHATAPLMNKLRAVLLRDFARDLLAARPQHSLNLAPLLDEDAIIIARLPKGVLGEDTSSLLGSLVLAQVWQGVLARAGQREAQRRDINLYLDEAHNFLTLPYGLGDMLAEARAYRAGLTIAHQDLAQLPRELREATSTNARSKIFFDVSPEDARALARHVQPELGEHDLSHLARFQAATRLVAHGALTPAFTLRTRPLPAPIRGRATAVRKAARTNHTRQPQ
ncbi:type IV secretory system conjugative DNA transfer family protein [Streptomonospora salina]|uniref:Putative ATPase n=1 Tax=Streptomonospora salina TaxID=104205 RepID=A0A841EAG0_9ACTN|nr:type IV secretory system conjugative DNA transfer family protein [Streptomonospora salina]MBB5998053.1 putative ATPase [Streptomonospora salina]